MFFYIIKAWDLGLRKKDLFLRKSILYEKKDYLVIKSSISEKIYIFVRK